MEQVTSDTLPPSAHIELQTCTGDGCTEAAVFSYRWEWGATGVACATCAALLQQTSTALNRSIALHPIVRSAPEPLLRDERIQLVAKHMVLEAELEEARSRGLEVYRKNGDLQVQLNTAIVKERELKAQVKDLQLQLDQVEARHAKVDAENGRLLVELDRLRALETFVAERDERERTDEGQGDEGERPNVVD